MFHNYREVLLKATYKNGKPGALTESHAKAEHHPFKQKFLIKNQKIPQNLYLSRLIQQYLIIEAIEHQLKNLNETEKMQINAFFQLSFIEQLWRTVPMQNDLKQLGIDKISKEKIAPTTKTYLDDLIACSPKVLLTHFLIHVAGFMHGGAIILNKYISPSNKLPGYQISTAQYDFSSMAVQLPKNQTTLGVYEEMLSQLEPIQLTEAEYQTCLKEGTDIYEKMATIYDDLWVMHIHQPKRNLYCFAYLCIALGFMAIILNSLLKSSNLLDYNSVFRP